MSRNLIYTIQVTGLGEYLQRLRQSKRITQVEIAQKLGLSVATIQKLEASDTTISRKKEVMIELVIRYLELLGENVDNIKEEFSQIEESWKNLLKVS